MICTYGSFFDSTSAVSASINEGAWLRLAKTQDVLVYSNFKDGTINFVVESLEEDIAN